ncbi:glucosaminidase domain-containing protein [Clostridium malenominatum]|uniref:Glucosaminidase domain-containing protein n=1 Tax=Clostridium malenominatum TaxID=1539 RepID=A0ABN1J1F4_9CLOT
MKSVLSELDKIKILNKSDMANIKNYIHKKYPENHEAENEVILLDAIDKVIYNKLEGLPEDLKGSVKDNVIKNTFGKDKISITLCDIFEACIREEKIIKDFTKELRDLVYSNGEVQITNEDISTHLETLGFKEIDSDVTVEEELNIESEVSIEAPVAYKKNFKKTLCIALMAIFIIPLYYVGRGVYINKQNQNKEENYVIESDKKENTSTKHPNLHLPEYMRYKEIDEEKLKEFLKKRESLLAEEPYFSTIVSVAEEFNLNPIVLFSITGQEQSFVPKSHKDANKIANNPFNVFHSWMEYNTDINDAARIASRTVINLSQNRPEDKEPFLWIGRKYAEDKNWGKGARAVFEELMGYTE